MRKEREEQNGVHRRSFTREQEEQLLAALNNPTKKVKNKQELRVLYLLDMFTGQRLKDCALLQWSRVDLSRRRIWVKQFKTGAEVKIPIADKLLERLEEAQAREDSGGYVLPKVAERYLVEDKNGKCIGANLLNIDVMRVVRWIGLEPSVEVPGRKKKVTVHGFHSLRRSFATHLFQRGTEIRTIQSLAGALGRSHDHDLHTCFAARRPRGGQSAVAFA
jgi:integrase